MSKLNDSTTLSMTRILATLAIFFAFPYAIDALNMFLQNGTISATVVLHTVTLLLVVLNFDVLEIHFKRLKRNFSDFVFFFILSIVLIELIFFFNNHWLHAAIWVPEKEVMANYIFFAPTMALAYSFSYAISFVISFKAITDRFKVHIGEKLIIFFSGVLFGLFVALSQSSLSLDQLIPLFIYYSLISAVTSYTYNQTHSIFTMACGYGVVLLINLL